MEREIHFESPFLPLVFLPFSIDSDKGLKIDSILTVVSSAHAKERKAQSQKPTVVQRWDILVKFNKITSDKMNDKSVNMQLSR